MGSSHLAPKRKAVLIRTSEGLICCLGSLTYVAGGYIGKGVTYLFIAFLLGLALWGLNRLKPSKPKHVRKKR